MDPIYNPHGVEEQWQRAWVDGGDFAADPDPQRDSYVIMIAPPNVTGSLHMGHALQNTIIDVLIRWRRMQGFNALWQPGYDHAGISTQVVVEKALATEGTNRRELGRERFEERVWEWLEKYGGVIMHQLRRLGASLDYRRERFTLDQEYSRAVIKFFVHLYDRGWIYRDNRIVNWCPRCETALSDLEVAHEEVSDTLYTIRYPLVGGGGVDIATVRPSTMLADVALAVHPDDARYEQLVGRSAIVPIVERVVPILADKRVEPEFGTGVVKVTPGHDALDFDIGRDHGLPELTVLDLNGLMNETAGEYAGLTQEEASERIVGTLRHRGLLIDAQSYLHSVGVCDKCGTRIEPLVTLQWFCEMKELAAPAIGAVKRGDVRFTPPRYTKVWLDWMESIRPWCVSRQLWWGHRLPVWYCPDGQVTVAETRPERCVVCGDTDLRQEEDVLDTWFSSALWPFATLGWPERTSDLDAFYPGDALVTDRQIIFLWVARMIMAGLELTGEVPFHDVHIHSTVNTPDGRRMSKSFGTGIDPLETIETAGADATRYGLLKMGSSQDVRYSSGTIDEGRRLANKLWNVSRLILTYADGVEPAEKPREPEERWILARIEETRREVEGRLSRFELSAAVKALYRLTFNDFCDWYAETIKQRLYVRDEDTVATALAALERLLKLLHPVIPHVTEEVWSHLPSRRTRLVRAPWPEPQETSEADVAAIQRVQDAAAIFRRSGVLVELSPDEHRIFDAVVRPGRIDTDPEDREVETRRLRAELDRAQRMLANERFVDEAPGEAVEAEREKIERYNRELAALQR